MAPEHLREKRLRKSLIRENESLAAHSDFLMGRFAELLAEAVADDLGEAPSDLRPRLVAAADDGGDGRGRRPPGRATSSTRRRRFESLLTFLRGGLAPSRTESAR